MSERRVDPGVRRWIHARVDHLIDAGAKIISERGATVKAGDRRWVARPNADERLAFVLGDPGRPRFDPSVSQEQAAEYLELHHADDR